jgi:hypothetical protein
MNFAKWLEYSDQGGEVSYNHMNNVAGNDGFNKIRSKYMAGNVSDTGKRPNLIKLFGKNTSKKYK